MSEHAGSEAQQITEDGLSNSRLMRDQNGIWRTPNAIGEIDYPDEGNDASFDLEDNSFWFRNRNQAILSIMDRFPFAGDFIDIGGGNGFQVKALAEAHPERNFHLIEPGYQGCQNAKARGVVNVYNMLSSNFPFNDHKVSAIGLFDVIEHIADDVGILSELKASVPSDTLYYVTVPAFSFLWSDVDSLSGHHRRYTKASMASLAKTCGLEVVFSSYLFSYLTLPMYLSRALPYRFGRSRSHSEIMKSEQGNHSKDTGRGVLDFLGELESKRLRSGGIPFGTSLICVLRADTESSHQHT